MLTPVGTTTEAGFNCWIFLIHPFYLEGPAGVGGRLSLPLPGVASGAPSESW